MTRDSGLYLAGTTTVRLNVGQADRLFGRWNVIDGSLAKRQATRPIERLPASVRLLPRCGTMV